MKSINPSVFQIGNALAFCYLVVEEREIYLIDTGAQLYSKTLNKIIWSQPKPLTTVFITHADGDHSGNAANIK